MGASVAGRCCLEGVSILETKNIEREGVAKGRKSEGKLRGISMVK